MTETANQQIIIQVLNDAVIFQRLTDRMQEALAVFNPQLGIESHFPPALNYNGYNTALDLIGLSDLNKYADLRDQLQEIAFKQAESFQAADEVARTIYFHWLHISDVFESDLKAP